MRGMRRISEILYTLGFFGCGIWAVVSGTGTLFSGLEDINVTGTWSCYLMLAIALTLKVFGDIGQSHAKTLVFIGLTALFGGVWGIGTILIILAGVVMITRGFKQIKVLREQVSIRELRQIRKKQLEEVKDEEVEYQEEQEDSEPKRSVAEELLEGFVGSDDHKQEIITWIDEEEFEKEELTPEEIRARAKKELRENKLSLETMLALEELDSMGNSDDTNEEKDLTHVDLDLQEEPDTTSVNRVTVTDEVGYKVEDYEDAGYSESKETAKQGKESPSGLTDDMMEMSIEDLFGE